MFNPFSVIEKEDSMLNDFVMSIGASFGISVSIAIVLMSVGSTNWIHGIRAQLDEEKNKPTLIKILTKTEYYSIVGGALFVLQGSLMIGINIPPVDSINFLFIMLGNLLVIAGILLEVRSYAKIKLNMMDLERRIMKLENNENNISDK